jgi:hypothetical protein
MAQTNFSGPVASAGGFTGDVTGDVTGTVTVPSYAFASLPATPTAGAIVLCTDAGVGSNEVILCYGDGTDWLRVDTGAAVTSGV